MKRVVAIIWGGLILVSYVVVVPLVVGLLRRALVAARGIERYTAETLAAGGGIAGNTAHVTALKDTIAAAPTLLAAADSLGRHVAAIEQALARSSAGPVTDEEVKQ